MDHSRLLAFVTLMVMSSGSTGLGQPNADLPLAEDRELPKNPITGQIPLEDAKILGFKLGSSPLAAIKLRMGVARAFRAGGEGSALALCYSSVDAGDDTALLFQAGALGGWKTLTEFAIAPRTSIRGFGTHCVESKEVSRSVGTAGGIRLGMGRDEFRRHFRRSPTIETADSVVYHFLKEVKVAGRKGHDIGAEASTAQTGSPSTCDLISGIQARFHDNRLIWLVVYKATAC